MALTNVAGKAGSFRLVIPLIYHVIRVSQRRHVQRGRRQRRRRTVRLLLAGGRAHVHQVVLPGGVAGGVAEGGTGGGGGHGVAVAAAAAATVHVVVAAAAVVARVAVLLRRRDHPVGVHDDGGAQQHGGHLSRVQAGKSGRVFAIEGVGVGKRVSGRGLGNNFFFSVYGKCRVAT